jgi:hypothetical protein
VLLRDQERPRLLLAELDPAWSELPQAEVTPAASVLEAGVWAAARVGVPVTPEVLDQVGYLRERRGPQGGSWTYTAVLSAVVPPNGASGWCSMVEATRRLAGAPVWPLVERVVNGR